MPEIERDKVRAMLAEAPEDQHESILTRLKERGYTVKNASAPVMPPGAALKQNQPIYPPQSELSKPQAAWQVMKGALGTDIPLVGPAVGAVREQIPNWIAEKGGQIGFPKTAATVGTAVSTAGELLPKNLGDLAAMVTAEPLAKGAVMVGKPFIRGTGEVLAEIAAKISGANKEAVKAVFKNPKIAAKFGDLLGQWDQANLVEAVQGNLKKVGGRFKAVQDALAGFAAADRKMLPRVNLEPALDATVQHMVDTGHRVPSRFTGITPKLGVGRLAEDSPDYTLLIKQLANLQKNKTLDFGEALNMRRQLDELIDFGQPGTSGMQKVGSEANRILKKMRDEVNVRLRESIPTKKRGMWDAANKAYSDARTAYDELKRQVVGTTPQITIQRIMRQVRSGRVEEGLEDRAAKIGKAAEKALMDIHDRVVAGQFHDFVRGGVATPAAAGWVGLHFGGLPGAVAGVVGSSPRMIGYGTAAAGGAAHATEALARQMLAHPAILSQATLALLRRHAPVTP